MTQILSPVVQEKVQATVDALTRAVAEYGDVVYANSLGAESMVLTDLICTQVPRIDIFSIDTGRLHEETYALLERIQRRYGRRIDLHYPQTGAVERLVRRQGINGFYNSLDERQGCCEVRKLEPFRRAIADRKAWVTGVRREQSPSRALGRPVEWDAANGLFKVSPLLEWTEREVWEYIRALELPYNPLHDRGFASIGCAPCTRPVEPGQDTRSGRWWWEQPESRECGLHPKIRIPVVVAQAN